MVESLHMNESSRDLSLTQEQMEILKDLQAFVDSGIADDIDRFCNLKGLSTCRITRKELAYLVDIGNMRSNEAMYRATYERIQSRLNGILKRMSNQNSSKEGIQKVKDLLEELKETVWGQTICYHSTTLGRIPGNYAPREG